MIVIFDSNYALFQLKYIFLPILMCRIP